MRALDVIAARTVGNEGGIVDLVAEFVIEVVGAGRVRGINAVSVHDIQHTVGLAEGIQNWSVGSRIH